MSIKWRKNTDGTKTAYLDITIPGCERIRESAGIRSDEPDAQRRAKEYHDQRRAELWRQARLGERPRYQWDQAVVRWLKEKQHKRSINKDIEHLRWLDIHLRGVWLDMIDRDHIERILQVKESTGVSNATVNRFASLIRAILRAACLEWGWLDSVPKVRMRKEGDGRITWAMREEADLLLQELISTAPHLHDAAEFALTTGLREQNVCRLTWDQVNMDAAVLYVYTTKNGRALGTPLNSEALAVLRRNRGKHPVNVFTYHGKPLTRLNNHAFRKAVARWMSSMDRVPDRLHGFNWHSLRHTWASWMAQGGCPLDRLQQLGGWQKMDMVQRYAHFSVSHLAEYAELSARQSPNLHAVRHS